MQSTIFNSSSTSICVKRDNLSNEAQKVLVFLADVSAWTSLKNVFNTMGRRGISENCVCYNLDQLVKMGLVEFGSDGYMITDEGEAIALTI